METKKQKLHAFTYIGGKFFLIPVLLKLVPEHHTFIEVCGGSGSFLLNKPLSKNEIYNDINANIVNFFRVLRNQLYDLIKLLKLTPYAREEFYSSRDFLPYEKCDIEKARKFFVFVGRGDSYGASYKTSPAKSFKNKVDKILSVAERMRVVQFENRDFRFIIQSYCKENSVFAYFDPPYLPETRVSNKDYDYEMTVDDHEELLLMLKKSKAKILISGYSSELYENHLKKWNRQEIDVPLNCKKTNIIGNKKPRRIEVLWYNYDI